MSYQTQCNYQLPVDNVRVLDRVIDVYLWLTDLNTDEVKAVGQHLINLADRRATDVELFYQQNRCIDVTYLNDIPSPDEQLYDHPDYNKAMIELANSRLDNTGDL